MRRYSLATTLLAATAVSALVGPAIADTYPRQPGIDVLDYVFRIALSDATDSISGMATVDLRFRESGVTSVALDLIGQGDGDTGMSVTGVWITGALGAIAAKSVDPETSDLGISARWVHQDDRLSIELPETSTANERLFITVAYHGVPATGLEIGPTKYGDRSFFSENWPNRARHWLPTVDHPYDKAMGQFVITAPDHYQVVSNGLVVEQTDLGDGMRRTHWRQGVPIATWLYTLGVARFAVQRVGEFDGKEIQTWVYAQDRDAGFDDFAVPTPDVLAYYQREIGTYSYEKLANIQSNSVGGGMESASAIFYGDDSVTGTRSERWRNVIIHEIAHQWFGNAVTESDWDDVWLSEGFATYFTHLFIEHAYGRDAMVARLRNDIDRVFGFYENRPDYRIVHDNLDDMRQVTTGMQYQKGSWTLHMLRGMIGTETFWEGIREYYRRYQDANASTDDFRRVMEETSGRELGWFFDQWLTQGGNPVVEGTWNWSGGAVELQLQQVQPGDYRFRLPMTVRLTFDDGSIQDQPIDLDPAGGAFTITAERAPVAVDLDPDTWVLMRSHLTSAGEGS